MKQRHNLELLKLRMEAVLEFANCLVMEETLISGKMRDLCGEVGKLINDYEDLMNEFVLEQE